MAKKLYEENSVRALADAIRARNGSGDSYTLSQMAPAVLELRTVDDTLRSFNQTNERAAAYLAAAGYTASDYTGSVMPQYEDVTQPLDDPLGFALTLESAGTLCFWDETDGRGWSEPVSAGSCTAYNLVPGHPTRWWLTDSNGRTVQNGRLMAIGALRMIYQEGTNNFRDLGGWVCDGGRVKYGLLLRGGQLVYAGSTGSVTLATAADLRRLRSWGVRCELDLRGEDEISETSSVLGSDVRFVLMDMDYYAAAVNLSGAALGETVKALKLLMDNVIHGVPTYFHCAAGADRTGTLAMLAEALLGVSQADLDKDYELTSFYPLQGYERLRSGQWKGLIDYMNTMSGRSFRDKCVQWALSAGIRLEEINAYRAAMIDGSPGMLDAADYTVPIHVSYRLSNVTSSNLTELLDENDAFTTTLSYDSAAYQTPTVRVTMGGADITASAYTAATGVVSIAAVTGDVTITAAAALRAVNMLLQAVDSSGQPFNGGTGWKAGFRLNSSGTESAQEGAFVTGFIPCLEDQTLSFENLPLPGNNSPENLVWCYIATYDENFNKIASNYSYQAAQAYSKHATLEGDYIKTYRMGHDTTYKTSGMRYFRVSSTSITALSAIYIS